MSESMSSSYPVEIRFSRNAPEHRWHQPAGRVRSDCHSARSTRSGKRDDVHKGSPACPGRGSRAPDRLHRRVEAVLAGYQLLIIHWFIEYIAETADPAAIATFRDHPRIFVLPTGDVVTLAAFLSEGIERPWAKRPASDRSDVVENAHDLRVGILLPAPSPGGDVRPHWRLMSFFRACADQGRRWLDAHPQTPVGEVESHLLRIYGKQAEYLLKFVLHDAVRAEKGPRSEYRCDLTKSPVRVFLPVSITGKERGRLLRAILEEEGHVY